MKKLQTLEEMIEGMNEFEKFVLFHRKNEERKRLVAKCHMLMEYNGMNMVTIAKAIRVSWRRLMAYYFGSQPMPDGFMNAFDNRLDKQLDESQNKKDKKSMDWYCSMRDIPSDDGKTETPSISSPSKAIA